MHPVRGRTNEPDQESSLVQPLLGLDNNSKTDGDGWWFLVTSVDGTHYIKADDNYSWLYHSLRRECLKVRCFFKIFFIKKIIKINFNKKKLNSLPREVVAARIAKVLLAN